jgi:hypothetical protein
MDDAKMSARKKLHTWQRRIDADQRQLDRLQKRLDARQHRLDAKYAALFPHGPRLTPDPITTAMLQVLHQKMDFLGSLNREAAIGASLRIRVPAEYTIVTR